MPVGPLKRGAVASAQGRAAPTAPPGPTGSAKRHRGAKQPHWQHWQPTAVVPDDMRVPRGTTAPATVPPTQLSYDGRAASTARTARVWPRPSRRQVPATSRCRKLYECRHGLGDRGRTHAAAWQPATQARPLQEPDLRCRGLSSGINYVAPCSSSKKTLPHSHHREALGTHP